MNNGAFDNASPDERADHPGGKAMFSRGENELLTRVGPGTPMGNLMRRYWVPVVFSHPIDKPDSPPVRVRLLGEDLVAFRGCRGVEGGYDAPHLTFLHAGSVESSRRVVPSFYEVVAMDFGFAIGTGRDLGDGDIHWNINVFLMPFHKIISSVPHAAHMWMPIDDNNTMLYSIDFRPDRPFTDEELAVCTGYDWIHTENIPGTDRAKANKDNDCLIDRGLQASGKSLSSPRRGRVAATT